MRWALTESTNQFHCWKFELAENTAELKYNKKASSFRITAGDKRLFFIERTGLLQIKFLVRTEYSVLIGEVYPVRNWHSGIIALENKKYNYWIKDNLLVLSSKKEGLSIAIEANDIGKTDQHEFCALLFGTLRVMAKSYKLKNAAALV